MYYSRYPFNLSSKNLNYHLPLHRLPQNWICDLYKFIDRYRIYDADNVTERKRFFLDIGGETFWEAVGAHGWFHHDRRRRIQESWRYDNGVLVIPKFEKFEYVDTGYVSK